MKRSCYEEEDIVLEPRWEIGRRAKRTLTRCSEWEEYPLQRARYQKIHDCLAAGVAAERVLSGLPRDIVEIILDKAVVKRIKVLYRES